MARMKFLCDADRCIECNACVTACKNEHEVPWGINRRRVVTINDGIPGERSVSVMARMRALPPRARGRALEIASKNESSTPAEMSFWASAEPRYGT